MRRWYSSMAWRVPSGTGRPVPEGTRQAIEEYQRRMAHVRQEIAGYEKDKQAVREQYAPIIERLEELAGS